MSALVLTVSDLAGWLSLLVMTLPAAHYLWSVALYFRHVHGRAHERDRPPGACLADHECPHVLLQIPIYNEPRVVEGALRAAVALDWPAAKLTVQLLDDSDDETTEIAAKFVAEMEAAGFDVMHVRRPEREGYKAGALAYGLKFSDAPFVAVKDADFRLPSDWLHATVGALIRDPDAAFCQCRLDFVSTRRTWTARIQQLAMDGHFVVEQAGRAWGGLPFQFNGTGGAWRREAIAAAGGWSGDTVTEDLDLIVRVAASGRHGVFLMDPAPNGEVPSDFAAWRVQQARWSAGTAQVLTTAFWHVVQAPTSLRTKMALLSMLSPALFFPAAALGLATLALGLILRGGDLTHYAPQLTIAALVVTAVVLGLTAPAFHRLKRGNWFVYAAELSLLPLFYMALALANAWSTLRSGASSMRVFRRTPKEGATDR